MPLLRVVERSGQREAWPARFGQRCAQGEEGREGGEEEGVCPPPIRGASSYTTPGLSLTLPYLPMSTSANRWLEPAASQRGSRLSKLSSVTTLAACWADIVGRGVVSAVVAVEFGGVERSVI